MCDGFGFPLPLWERGWGSGPSGGRRAEGGTDLGKGLWEVPLYKVCGESEHSEVEGFEQLLAVPVILRLGRVDRAVNLDDQPLCAAEKIHDKRPKGLLAAEATPVKLLPP